MKKPRIQKPRYQPPTKKDLGKFYGLGFEFLQRNLEMQKLQWVARVCFSEDVRLGQANYPWPERYQRSMDRVIRQLLGYDTKAAPSCITDDQKSLLH